MRARRSAKLIPAALTATRTSPGPGSGSGRSSTFRTSGPPYSVITSARTARTLTGEHAHERRSAKRGLIDGARLTIRAKSKRLARAIDRGGRVATQTPTAPRAGTVVVESD